jgi:hypothetical protein
MKFRLDGIRQQQHDAICGSTAPVAPDLVSMSPTNESEHLDRIAGLAARAWWKRKRPMRIDGVRFSKLSAEERFAFELGWRETEHCVTVGMDSYTAASAHPACSKVRS